LISRKFIKSSLIYTIAGALPMASVIILLPFYMEYLSPKVYGELSLYLAFSMFVQILVTYSFDTSIYVYFHEYKNDPKKLKRFISSVFVFLILSGIVVTAVFTLIGGLIFDNLFEKQELKFYPYGLLSTGTAVFQAIFKVFSSLLQSREKPVTYFWSNIIAFSLIAGLTVIGLEYYPQTLVGPIGGRAIAGVVSAVWALIIIVREFGLVFDFALLRLSFTFNNSSFIYQLQLWSMNYFDRMLLAFVGVPMEQLGVYDFAMKCMMAIDFIIGGLYNSFYPKVLGTVMGQEKKEATIQTNRYYHGLTAVIMLLVCLATPGFEFIIKLGIIKSGYEAAVVFIPLIGVIYLLRSMRYYFALPYGALKYSKPLPWIYLVVSVMKIGIFLALGYRFGVMAVIVSAMISTILEVVLLRQFIQNKFTFKVNVMKLVVGPSALAAGILATFFIAGEIDYLAQIIFLAACVAMLFWLYRNELKQLSFAKILNRRTTDEER
jgi:O-antigen/teichoic acid export membrane protein